MIKFQEKRLEIWRSDFESRFRFKFFSWNVIIHNLLYSQRFPLGFRKLDQHIFLRKMSSSHRFPYFTSNVSNSHFVLYFVTFFGIFCVFNSLEKFHCLLAIRWKCTWAFAKNLPHLESLVNERQIYERVRLKKLYI